MRANARFPRIGFVDFKVAIVSHGGVPPTAGRKHRKLGVEKSSTSDDETLKVKFCGRDVFPVQQSGFRALRKRPPRFPPAKVAIGAHPIHEAADERFANSSATET